MDVKGFFDELAPRLETARILDRELDRNLAHRFNVLDYLKTDELGLSRIIADLFNPKASHGQGTLFLRRFLANLKGLKETPDLSELDRNQITVETEQWKVDITVEINCPDGKYCLAIENKPYARDQENQVKRYLELLEGEYGNRFLLIYLPPTGEAPASIGKNELKEKWNSRFAILPYHKSHEELEDEFNEFRLSHSLADWLGECRRNCDVERLRWFLRDAETFCKRKFGGLAMTTDNETKAVEKYVLLDSEKWKTAGVVYESWAGIRNKVCKEFLQRLCSAIEQKARANSNLEKFADDRKIEHSYDGERKYKNWLCLYRNCWAQYEQGDRSISDGRTVIVLQNDERGPNGWCIGVSSPIAEDKMEPEEKERRLRLNKELNGIPPSNEGPDSYWPWWNWVEEDKRNWDSLVPELHQENEDNGGKITSYFVDRFIEIAEKAVPIVDKIESR